MTLREAQHIEGMLKARTKGFHKYGISIVERSVRYDEKGAHVEETWRYPDGKAHHLSWYAGLPMK